MANAGRVAIVPKGDYSSSTAYNRLDLVRYNEKAYVAKKANTGISPTNTEYWMLMTSDGITIDTALSETSTNPVQNKVVKTALDNIQTTRRATLSTAGWYRVAEFASSIASVLKGSSANSCTVALKKMHDSKGSEEYSIRLRSVYTSQEFKCEDSKVNGTQQITKIRYTHDSGKAYIELYCTGSGNTTYVEINSPQNAHATWQAITPTLTSETVDGVTVTTTYDIPANASPVSDLDLANYLPTDGNRSTLNPVSDVNNFLTGVGLFRDGALNIPHGTGYWLIIAGGLVGTGVQLAIDLFNNERIKMRNCASGTWGAWGDVNVGLADYLPKTGGTVGNGTSIVPLTLKGVDKEVYQKFTNHNDELMGYLGFKGKDTPVFRDNTYTDRELLHTGNKPTGTYTGNGSATTRTINTGGTGFALALTGYGYSSIVFPNGLIYTTDSTGVIGGLPKTKVNFENGILTISTATDSQCNRDGSEYRWQVL